MDIDLLDPVLAGLLADQADLRARLLIADDRVTAYLIECVRPPGAAPQVEKHGWPASASHPELLTPRQAARRAGRSVDTISRWCRNEGIGRRYGKRWRVSARLLDAKLRR